MSPHGALGARAILDVGGESYEIFRLDALRGRASTDDVAAAIARCGGSARTRARLACSLRGAVELADRQWEPLSLPSAMIRRAEVRANRELLLELAERLRTTGPLGAGVSPWRPC